MATHSRQKLEQWQRLLATKDAAAVISWAHEVFQSKLVFASSLGAEDQVIAHLIAQEAPAVRIFTLDTGRLFSETYDLIERTEKRYGIRIETFSPNTDELEAMIREHGVNLFYRSVELRKLCCGVRKIHPLRRALSQQDAWICGLRRTQSVTRQELQALEWDDSNGLIKVSPLWNWGDDEVWRFIKDHAIPYNPLHDQGFLSIGCSCCTRAVSEGEDIRAGRWWWESPQHKECGLHLRDGKLVPVRSQQTPT